MIDECYLVLVGVSWKTAESNLGEEFIVDRDHSWIYKVNIYNSKMGLDFGYLLCLQKQTLVLKKERENGSTNEEKKVSNK